MKSANVVYLIWGLQACGNSYTAHRLVADKTSSVELVDEVLDEALLAAGMDLLTGSSGSDWFIINQEDKVTDFKKMNKDEDMITYV